MLLIEGKIYNYKLETSEEIERVILLKVKEGFKEEVMVTTMNCTTLEVKEHSCKLISDVEEKGIYHSVPSQQVEILIGFIKHLSGSLTQLYLFMEYLKNKKEISFTSLDQDRYKEHFPWLEEVLNPKEDISANKHIDKLILCAEDLALALFTMQDFIEFKNINPEK